MTAGGGVTGALRLCSPANDPSTTDLGFKLDLRNIYMNMKYFFTILNTPL